MAEFRVTIVTTKGAYTLEPLSGDDAASVCLDVLAEVQQGAVLYVLPNTRKDWKHAWINVDHVTAIEAYA